MNASERRSARIAIAPSMRGSLHRALGVPEGTKIPKTKLAKALKSPNAALRKKANFARNAAKWNK